jgi:hypothetical protein
MRALRFSVKQILRLKRGGPSKLGVNKAAALHIGEDA